MTHGELIEALVGAYLGFPWETRSVLVALVVDELDADGRAPAASTSGPGNRPSRG